MGKRLRIVDSYCGVGPWATKSDISPYTTDEILAIMDDCGVDKAIIFGNTVFSSAWQHDANRLAMKAAAESDRFIPAFILAPGPYDDSPTPEDLAAEMKKGGARVAWFWPSQERHSISLWAIGDLLKMCSERKLPVFLPVDGILPDQIHDICRNFPKLRLVLANMDYNSDSWLYPLLRLHPELRACLGHRYVPPLGPERFVKHFGEERLIFGSGLPLYGAGGLIAHVMYSNLKDADKSKILAGNIERLMKEVRL